MSSSAMADLQQTQQNALYGGWAWGWNSNCDSACWVYLMYIPWELSTGSAHSHTHHSQFLNQISFKSNSKRPISSFLYGVTASHSMSEHQEHRMEHTSAHRVDILAEESNRNYAWSNSKHELHDFLPIHSELTIENSSLQANNENN